MRFWSFIAFGLIGLSIGLYSDCIIPGIIGGIGFGLLSVVGISLIYEARDKA